MKETITSISSRDDVSLLIELGKLAKVEKRIELKWCL
jgi:hypothetical protein